MGVWAAEWGCDGDVTGGFDGAILGTHGSCAPLTLNTIIV